MKKKICVLIILGLFLLSIIFVGIYFYKNKNVQSVDNSNDISVEEFAETEIADEMKVSENTNQIDKLTENNTIITNNTENEKSSIQKKQDKKQISKIESNSKQKNEVKSEQITPKKEVKDTKDTQNNLAKEENKATTKKEEKTETREGEKDETQHEKTKNQEIQKEKEEKYIRNDTMIEKIKTVIQNNESDFMKKYGYNIVVDSSIKNLTNQFTYTEKRVKSMLVNKFGTIRIYVEDYYVDGQLIMTECYLM